jgi:hypothetical protein
LWRNRRSYVTNFPGNYWSFLIATQCDSQNCHRFSSSSTSKHTAAPSIVSTQ